MNHAQSPPDAQPGAAQAAFQLNLRHLRGLTAVHEHGSISAAAGAVGLSQPALTQGILKLEKLMGEVLFERRPDGIVPTAAGELVVDRARACLAHLATGTRQVGGTAFEPDRRLSMTQLRAFVALVRAGSISAAAADLGLSQPAVHRAVRELEENGFTPDYVAIRRAHDLDEADPGEKDLVVLVAAYLGKARLIDNIDLTL